MATIGKQVFGDGTTGGGGASGSWGSTVPTVASSNPKANVASAATASDGNWVGGQATEEGAAKNKAAIEAAKARREAQAQSTTVTQEASPQTVPTSQASSSPERNLEAEQATIQQIGSTPNPNNLQEVLDFAEATYGDNLPAEFQALKDRLDSLSGGGLENADDLRALSGDISQFGQSALAAQGTAQAEGAQIGGQLNVLQEALKKKSGVGNEKLGTSQIFEQAGVGGMGALNQSLNARMKEIDFRFNSFSNVVDELADFQYGQNAAQLAEAQTALQQYALLKDEYKFEQNRLDQLEQSEQNFQRSLQLSYQNHQYSLEELAFKAGLEQQSSMSSVPIFDSNGNLILESAYTGSDGLVYLPSGQSVAQGQRATITDSDPLASKLNSMGEENRKNCVTYAREYVKNLPYGLWQISDKIAAVENYGSTDMSGVQIGDVILTREGAYGHAAVVVGMDRDNLILREANYTAGQVTEGRMINKADSKVIGYVPNKSTVAGVSGSVGKPSSMGVLEAGYELAGEPFSSDWQKKAAGYKHNQMATQYEGMNPNGAETFIPSQRYSDKDLMNAYQNALVRGGTDLSDIDVEGYTFANKYLAAGDYQNAKQVIWNSAMDAIDVTERKEIKAGQDAVDALVTIEDLLNKYKNSGGDMGLLDIDIEKASDPKKGTNYIKGQYEKIARKLGVTSESYGYFIQIQTYVDNLVDIRARQRTGAAMTEYETTFYNRMFPSLNNMDTINQALINTQIDIFNKEARNRVGDAIGKDYYDKLFGADTLAEERGWGDEDAANVQKAYNSVFSF